MSRSDSTSEQGHGAFLYSIPSVVSASSASSQYNLMSNPFTRMADRIDLDSFIAAGSVLDNDDDNDVDSRDFVCTQIACTQVDDHILHAQQHQDDNKETGGVSDGDNGSLVETLDIGLLSCFTRENSLSSGMNPPAESFWPLAPLADSPVISGDTASTNTLSKTGSLLHTAEAEAILAEEESDPPKNSLYAKYLAEATATVVPLPAPTTENQLLQENVQKKVEIVHQESVIVSNDLGLTEYGDDMIGANHLPGLGFSQTQDVSPIQTKYSAEITQFADLPGLGFSQTEDNDLDQSIISKTPCTGISFTPRSQTKISKTSPMAYTSPVKQRLGFSQSQSSQTIPPLFENRELINSDADTTRAVGQDQGPSTSSAPTQLSPSVEQNVAIKCVTKKSSPVVDDNTTTDKTYHLSPVQGNLVDFIPSALREIEIRSDRGTLGSQEVSVRDMSSPSLDRSYSYDVDHTIDHDDAPVSVSNAFRGSKSDFYADTLPSLADDVSISVNVTIADSTIVPSEENWLDSRSIKPNTTLPFCDPSMPLSSSKVDNDKSFQRFDDIEDWDDNMSPSDIIRAKRKKAKLAKCATSPSPTVTNQLRKNDVSFDESGISLSQSGKMAVSDLLSMSSASVMERVGSSDSRSEKMKGPLLKRTFKNSEQKLVRLKRKSESYNLDLSDDDDVDISEDLDTKKGYVKHIRFKENTDLDEEEAEWSSQQGKGLKSPHSKSPMHFDEVDSKLNKTNHTFEEIPESLFLNRQNLGNFRQVWASLEEVGWTWQKGKELIDFYYIRPGKHVPAKQPSTDIFLSDVTEDPDYFVSTNDVLAYVQHCINRHDRSASTSSDKSPLSVKSSSKSVFSVNKSRTSPLSQSSSASKTFVSNDWWNEACEIVLEKLALYSAYNSHDREDDDLSLVFDDLPVGLCVYIDQGDAFYAMLTDSLSTPPEYLSDFLDSLKTTSGDSKLISDKLIKFIEGDIVSRERTIYGISSALKWSNIWAFLNASGWTCKRGKELVDYYYIRPNIQLKASSRKSQDFFESVDETLEYLQQKLLTRPDGARYRLKSDSLNCFVKEIMQQFQPKVTASSSIPFSSPNVSLKPTIEVEDWFLDSMSLDWTDVVWPRLEERGWRQLTDSGSSGNIHSFVILMPSVKLDEISLGKNAFSSQDDVRRYLLVLYTQWSQLWKQRGSSGSKGKVSPGSYSKTPSSSISSKAKVETSSRSVMKQNNNINSTTSTFVVTPQDAIKSKQDKSISKNNTSTPLDVSIKTQSNNKRARVKSAKYSREEFLGESQFDAIEDWDDNISPSDVARAQRKKEKLAKLASSPSLIVDREKSAFVNTEEEPTQLQAYSVSPQKSKSYSPVKKSKHLFPANEEKAHYGTCSSNHSIVNASTLDVMSQSKREKSYRFLPKEATIDVQVDFLPLWVKMLNTSPSTSDEKVFKDMKFVLTGIEYMISVDREKLCKLLTKNGGEILKSIPDPGNTTINFYEKPASSDGSFRQVCFEGRDSKSKTSWLYDHLVVLSHPYGCRRETYLLACSLEIPLVHPSWAIDCVSGGVLLPLDQYLLPTAFTPLKPFMCFKRNQAEGGIFRGLRILDLMSPVNFSKKDVADLGRSDDRVFNDLITAIKSDHTQIADGKQLSLGWYSKTLLAAGATLCDPRLEIPRAIFVASTMGSNKNLGGRGRAHQQIALSSLTPNCASYTPPDIIIVDSNVFCDNCDFVNTGTYGSKKPSRTVNPHHAIIMQAVNALEAIIDYRSEKNLFTPSATRQHSSDRFVGRGHGIIVTTDWASNCIGLGSLLFPPSGFIPKQVLGLDSLKHVPSEVFGLPGSPDNFPWIWKAPNGGERFLVGDFVVFRNTGEYSKAVRVDDLISSDGLDKLLLGRIVKFSRPSATSPTVATVNIIFSGGSDGSVDCSSMHVVGDAETILVRRAAVFSSSAYRNLLYCTRTPTEKASKVSPTRSSYALAVLEKPEPFVFRMSDRYEIRDGFVEWLREDGRPDYLDDYERLGFDRTSIGRVSSAESDSDNDGNGDASTAMPLSQDY